MKLEQHLTGLSKEEIEFIKKSVFKGKTTQEWFDNNPKVSSIIQDAITFGHLKWVDQGGAYAPIEDMDVKKEVAKKFIKHYHIIKYVRWISYALFAFGIFQMIWNGFGIGFSILMVGVALYFSTKGYKTMIQTMSKDLEDDLKNKKLYEQRRRDAFKNKGDSSNKRTITKKSKFQERLEQIENENGKRKTYSGTGPR